jgi:hypothetical protein
MKKKTVITTEKREVWVIREGISEVDQSIDVGDALEILSASPESALPTDGEESEMKEEK